MSFYNSEFFAGCESLMEDDTVEAEAKVTVTPEEQAEEVAEAEEVATETAETTADVEEGVQQTEMVFSKFDEIDRMIKHVETFGVDKAFLSLCNHDDILNKSFGLGLPAVEAFDEPADPKSAVSQAALEGLKETASKFWEWLKRMAKRLGDWIVRLAKLYDIRISRGITKAEELAKRAKTASIVNKDDVKDLKAFKADEVDKEFLSTPTEAVTDAKATAAELAVAAKKAYEAAGKIMKTKVPEARKKVADLNTKAAAADASKKDEARTVAKEAAENVKKLNAELAIKVRNAGKFLGNAASILKNGTKDKKADKKEAK